MIISFDKNCGSFTLNLELFMQSEIEQQKLLYKIVMKLQFSSTVYKKNSP